MKFALSHALVLAVGLTAAGGAFADTGKLLLTGGVSTIDGAAGGGISPWAVIGTNATAGEIGASAYATHAATKDYALGSYGAAFAWNERLEVSVAHQDFDASPAIALNSIANFGVRRGQHIRMDVLGVKARVAGDAVLDADSWMPQISVGALYKHVDPGSLGSVLDFLGAKRDGVDVYVSATKLFLGQSLLVNGTLRASRANQNGLLGFGANAPGHNGYTVRPEVSAAYLLNRHVAVGAEYRAKPNNLQALGQANGLGDALREDAWKDLFVAWAPNKNVSVTLAYVDLGRIVPGITHGRRQTGYYLSAQFAF